MMLNMDVIAVLSLAVIIPTWLLVGTMAARDTDARGRSGRWVGVAWVLCFPIGLLLWVHARRSPRSAHNV